MHHCTVSYAGSDNPGKYKEETSRWQLALSRVSVAQPVCSQAVVAQMLGKLQTSKNCPHQVVQRRLLGFAFESFKQILG
jgi:hypothetical protein